MEESPNISFSVWGRDLIDENTFAQMREACGIPVARYGALMPDAHLGYGLPIGGVLATKDAVIPYAVGFDIACRMKLSVLGLPADHNPELLADIIEDETRFGVGSHFETPRHHDVLDCDWGVTQVTAEHKDKARSQLGSSGGGNHFVEFGAYKDSHPGSFLALLSHSGSRGTGHSVCTHYSKLAKEQHPEGGDLAWLDMDTTEGQGYWEAMALMGKYASANHDCIHDAIIGRLGAKVLGVVENHHNFAWKEEHFGEDVVVHRKGATPAKYGELGVIPGTMADPTHVVRGCGNKESLDSSAHGAGRRMGRNVAKKTLDENDWHSTLRSRDVTLLSAGLDEAPAAYKSIEDVMGAQEELVETVGHFYPRVVKMSPPIPHPDKG